MPIFEAFLKRWLSKITYGILKDFQSFSNYLRLTNNVFLLLLIATFNKLKQHSLLRHPVQCIYPRLSFLFRFFLHTGALSLMALQFLLSRRRAPCLTPYFPPPFLKLLRLVSFHFLRRCSQKIFRGVFIPSHRERHLIK